MGEGPVDEGEGEDFWKEIKRHIPHGEDGLDPYPHMFFPDECALCNEGWRNNPLLAAIGDLEKSLSDIPTPELDHIVTSIQSFMQEWVVSELYSRPDWRDRYEPGWRGERGMPE
jgi:hypothetical protein